MANRGVRGHISVTWRPTQRLGTYPAQTLGTDEMSDEISSVAGATYYGSEDVDRVRCNVSSPLSFAPKGHQNRRDIVGSREMDQALRAELVSQGKLPPTTKPQSKPVKFAVVEPDQIKHARDIQKFSWWPHQAWDEFLGHRVECGLPNHEAAVISLALQVLEIHDAGHNPTECLESSMIYGRPYNVCRPEGTYPDEWSWSA
jgi:hypothetical protein